MEFNTTIQKNIFNDNKSRCIYTSKKLFFSALLLYFSLCNNIYLNIGDYIFSYYI